MRSASPSILCAVALASALPGACGPPNDYVAPPAAEVTVAHPASRSYTEYLYFTGRASAVATVDVRARVEGFLQEVFFDEGDIVEQGDLLCKIDPSEYQARVDEAQAAVAEAQARFDLATATLKRLQKALETNAVSVLEVDEKSAERTASRASLESARAEARVAALHLEWTDVVAPMAGRVGLRVVDPGNLVGAGENTLLTTIVVYDPIYVDFDVDERTLVQALEADVRAGRIDAASVAAVRDIPLEVGVAGKDDYPIVGKAHYFAQEVDPGTGTLMVRGIFPNPEPPTLLPGLFVRVRNPRKEVQGLMLPEVAIGTDQSGRYVLVVGDDDVVEQRSLTVGPLIDGARVIHGGVEADERVVVNGLLRARAGAKVLPTLQAAAEPAPTPDDG